ncbi:hypothetical protein ACFC3F_05015 [Microbacterium sp. NPDC055910]|uniref:ParB family protein n=1 Tax=Microbacterium sp. NPDC055910 TaxID=3345659 RepID=UPI0035D87478
MTDSTRGITGLAPRKVDPKRMFAANRDAETATPPAPEEVSAGTPAPETPKEQPTKASTAPNVRPKAQQPRKPAPPAQGAQGRVNTYIDAGKRARVVAAYKATAHLEGDESFSAFVETALVNEAIRREQLHNSGNEFAAAGKLQRGRPVRD